MHAGPGEFPIKYMTGGCTPTTRTCRQRLTKLTSQTGIIIKIKTEKTSARRTGN